MNDDIKKRLSELKDEQKKGLERLEDINKESSSLSQVLFRISGAIQALSEFDKYNGLSEDDNKEKGE